MLDVFSSWTTWLVGGSVLTALAAAALAYALGAQRAAEVFAEFLSPIARALGGVIGGAITFVWENTRDGLAEIAKSGKAIFALLVVGALVAVSVYVPAVKHTSKKTWAKAHQEYTLLPKKKVAAKSKKSSPVSETLRNFMR